MVLKVLNLYSGIGGNRMKWGDKYEVTSVEYSKQIANVYTQLFPNDRIIIGDAMQYLLKHYHEFDIIWASPPCQTHSLARSWEVRYIDCSLYQIILFLDKHFEGKYIVENVNPYYGALIKPTKMIDRHCFWTNFNISDVTFSANNKPDIQTAKNQEFLDYYGINMEGFTFQKGLNKNKMFRNMVDPELGNILIEKAVKPSPNLFQF